MKRFFIVVLFSTSLIHAHAADELFAQAQAEKQHNPQHAIALYQRALDTDPHHFRASFELSNALFRARKYHEAAQQFQHALSLDPMCAQACFNYGLVLLAQNKNDDAFYTFERAATLNPKHAKAHVFIGRYFEEKNRPANAIVHYAKAIKSDKKDISAHKHLARLYHNQQQYPQAIEIYKKAAALTPNDTQLRFDLGNTYNKVWEFDQAIFCFQHILEAKPHLSGVRCNMAHTHRYQGDYYTAIPQYLKVLAAKPDHPHAHYGLAESLLATGHFEQGFEHFEWRLRRSADTRKLLENQWDGSNPHGKTILLRAEYGQGDTMQFIRYAKQLKQMGAHIIAEVQHTLVDLLKLCPYIDVIIVVTDPVEQLPPHDYQLPFMSLPHVMNTTLKTIPRDIPYLYADKQLIKYWQRKLPVSQNLKIGICWEGSPYYEQFKSPLSRKAIALAEFIPLAQLENVEVYSLQKMNGVEQLAQLPDDITIHHFKDFDHNHGRFMDTAALIENLDLVVTVDTSIAHLAGALGKEVWVLLPQVADWRWFVDREDSPWYQGMRLFRNTNDDWKSVIQRVCSELKLLVENNE